MGEIHATELKRIGAGREAEIFVWDDGRVLRLARTPQQRTDVDRERTALQLAARCGAPVPTVYDQVEVDGRSGLVLERLAGRDLLAGLPLRPWDLLLIPWILARLHASLHATIAAPELPELRAELERRLRSQLVPRDINEAALRVLERLPDGEHLCHGDFHPGNVLRRRGGGYAVIDWKNASRGDPAADIARTRLLITRAWIPRLGNTPLQLALAPFRSPLYLAYRLIHRGHRSVPYRDLKPWIAVIAAARLAEDTAQERTRLLAIARRRLRHR